MGTSNTSANERRLRARFVHRAIATDAPLLAPLLHRYATAEGLTWDELAQSLDCSVDALNQVAICRPPGPEHFVTDARAIAADYVDPDRLLPLLRRLQVIAAFADRDAGAANREILGRYRAESGRLTLLAARDREDEPEPPLSPADGTPQPAPETDHD